MGSPQTPLAITGATGFIGRALCARLRAGGYRVKALVRNPEAASGLAGIGVELVPGDLESRPALDSLLRESACLIHCAATVRGNSQQAFDRVNVDGTRTLLESALAMENPPRFIHLSSLAAREAGLSWYAGSKRRSEDLVLEAGAILDPVILRPPPVYGPGDREMLPIFKLMKRGIAPVPGSAEARISLLHVDDLVEAIIACITHPNLGTEPLTPTDPRRQGYDWQEMAEIAARLWQRPVRLARLPRTPLNLVASVNLALSRLLGYAPMLTPSKLRELRHDNWVADCSPVESATGWKPETGLEDGLAELCKTVL